MERLSKWGRDGLAPPNLSLVNDYNKYMGEVDKNDTPTGNYTYARKTFK